MNKIRRNRETDSNASSWFAVQPHQIALALQPRQSTRSLVDQQIDKHGFAVRRNSIWNDDPEPAPAVPERPAKDVRS